MSNVTLYQGDCAEVLKTLDAASIDLTVTSPPYDNLRTYKNYTGFDFPTVARELYRVTKPGGVVVWVVADATINGSETGTSFRQALGFMEVGFNLHDTMIYQVAGTGAKGSTLAYWQSFEYMFVLSKDRPKSINLLRDKKNSYAGSTHKAVVNNKYDGRVFNKPVTVLDFGTRCNVWPYHAGNNGDDYTDHPAPFPEQLAGDHILSWSNPGDTILDPFTGSGTTGKMAVKYQRDFVGIEIAAEYLAIAEKRIKLEQAQLHLPGVMA